MKYLLILLVGVFGTSPVNSENAIVQQQETFDLKVIVTNVKDPKGLILLGIYNSPDGYLKDGKAYRFSRHKVDRNQVEIILKDIPKGTYAISLCHDVNSDKKCNTNFLGIPQEPYGFSNGFKRRLSKPSFNDCKFEVNESRTVKVELIH